MCVESSTSDTTDDNDEDDDKSPTKAEPASHIQASGDEDGLEAPVTTRRQRRRQPRKKHQSSTSSEEESDEEPSQEPFEWLSEAQGGSRRGVSRTYAGIVYGKRTYRVGDVVAVTVPGSAEQHIAYIKTLHSLNRRGAPMAHVRYLLSSEAKRDKVVERASKRRSDEPVGVLAIYAILRHRSLQAAPALIKPCLENELFMESMGRSVHIKRLGDAQPVMTFPEYCRHMAARAKLTALRQFDPDAKTRVYFCRDLKPFGIHDSFAQL